MWELDGNGSRNMFPNFNLFFTKYWNLKIVKDAVSLFIGRGINLAIGFFSTLVYGIVFSNTEIAQINLFEMVASMFLSFGFTWSAFGIIRFGKEEELSKGTINHTSSVRLWVVFPLLTISILLIILFRNNLLNYIGTNDRSMIPYLIVNVVLFVSHEHITSTLTTAEKHRQNVLFYLGISVGKLCLLIVFYFHCLDVTAELYIKVNVAVLFVLLFLRIPFLKKNYFLPFGSVSKKDLITFLKFVIPQIYGFTGLYLIDWMDVYFIRRSCDLAELGSYQFLYSIFMKIASFALLLNTLFFPKIVNWKNYDQTKLKKYLKRFPNFIFLISMLSIALFISIYYPAFSCFFKDKYVVAYPSFNLILLTIPFYFLVYVFVPVLNTYERVRYIQVVNLVSALSNLLIDFFLIKHIGIVAAAFGTFVAFFIKYLLLLFAIMKMFQRHYILLILGSSLVGLSVMVYILHLCL